MKSRFRNRIEKYRTVSRAIRSVSDAIEKSVERNKDVVLSLNRDQMLLGRNAHGLLLSPTYQQDPYFKTQEEADAYARMKEGLEGMHKSRLWSNVQVYPSKPLNVPNLIVTGKFQDGMFITTGAGNYTIWSTFSDTGDIDTKYNGVFGLAPKSVDYFWINFLRIDLIKHLGIWDVNV